MHHPKGLQALCYDQPETLQGVGVVIEFIEVHGMLL
jgi:hypothetical protein